ncbi:SirB2 family protein [Halomonas qinghailakensis]|uniref:SirB2 family protein n=1 Tax=Halomonas qinghailakensis TaxID=2937790 RepID=A0AA46YSQ0_9GAMM|nr:SirB2 family protein [Halomonas sp. ZZQ-149]UYO75667.1 SirB2 family protein [Halomonas sp. ZZQ-149]
MEHYFVIKHLHVTAAVLSITLFVVRAWWSVRESPRLNARWVRVLPHLIDTALLGLGVTLLMLLSIWPWQLPWLGAKLLALLAYIGIGTFAIKRGKTPQTRAVAALVAIVLFAYMVGAAIRHSPLSWLA